MIKFSIIVPVYNTGKYLSKCLQSILEQSYSNFEVIIVNDGSTDNSRIIIESFLKKFDRVKIIDQENKGLSVARNIGIESSTGDYFLLIDSDDYIEKDLLKKLSDFLENKPDLVRFQMRKVNLDKGLKKDYCEREFFDFNGKKAFEIISDYHYVEPACCYLYRTNYFKENHFLFTKGRYHEDFGLIPLVIVKAKKVNSINYIGYNYVQHEGSIMNNDAYDKTVKKAYDALEQFKNLITYDGGSVYKSFLANSVILKLNDLKSKDYKIYLSILRKLDVFDNVLADTIPRKIKKLVLKINPKLYLKMR